MVNSWHPSNYFNFTQQDNPSNIMGNETSFPTTSTNGTPIKKVNPLPPSSSRPPLHKPPSASDNNHNNNNSSSSPSKTTTVVAAEAAAAADTTTVAAPAEIIQNFILAACGGGENSILTVSQAFSKPPPQPYPQEQPPSNPLALPHPHSIPRTIKPKIVIEGGPISSPPPPTTINHPTTPPLDDDDSSSDSLTMPENADAIHALTTAWESSSVTGGSIAGRHSLSGTNNVTQPSHVTNPTGHTTSLHRLAFRASWDEMRSTLTEGSARPSREANTLDEYGRTPLMVACTQGKELPADITRLLLVAGPSGASRPIEGGGGSTYCLHVAAASGCEEEVMGVLIKAYSAAAGISDKNGAYPLHLAINTNRWSDGDELVKVVELLIGAYPEALLKRNNRGETPLILAIYRRAPTEVLKLLLRLEDGLQAARIPDAFGSTPLHFCDRTPACIVRELVMTYPEAVSMGNKLGDTPLFFALHGKCPVEVLEILLRYGTDISKAVKIKNSQQNNVIKAGWDMLNDTRIVAAEDQDDEDRRVTQNRVCIRNAASPDEIFGEVRIWWKKTELLLRAAYHNSTLYDIPLNDRPTFRVVHASAGTECPPALIKFILQLHKTAATTTDENGNTPLHIACALPEIISVETIKHLYNSHPSALLVQNRDGSTPLHVAALHRAPLPILDVLIAANTDACLLKDKRGQTPLFLAIAVNSPASVLRHLLRANVPAVHIRDSRGVSPLGLAWLLLVSGKIVGEKDESKEQARGKANRLSVAVARSSGSLVGGVREWMGKIDLLLRGAFHGKVDHPLPKGRQWRAVHAAAMGGSCHPSILSFALQILPGEAMVLNEGGDLPLHIAARAPPYKEMDGPELGSGESLDLLLELHPDGAKRGDRQGRLPLHLALETRKTWWNGVSRLVEVFPEAVRMRDPGTMLYPFMLAATAAVGTGDREVYIEVMMETQQTNEDQPQMAQTSSQDQDKTSIVAEMTKSASESDEKKHDDDVFLNALNENDVTKITLTGEDTGLSFNKTKDANDDPAKDDGFRTDNTTTTIQTQASTIEGETDLLITKYAASDESIERVKSDDNLLMSNSQQDEEQEAKKNSTITPQQEPAATTKTTDDKSTDGSKSSSLSKTNAQSTVILPSSSNMSDQNKRQQQNQSTRATKITTTTTTNTKIKVTPELASITTIYQLLRQAPDLISITTSQNQSQNNQTSSSPFHKINAETLYLWRSHAQLQSLNAELQRKLSVKEAELRSRMSSKELKDLDDRKKQEEVRKREEECAARADALERTSGNHRSWMFSLENVVGRLKDGSGLV